MILLSIVSKLNKSLINPHSALVIFFDSVVLRIRFAIVPMAAGLQKNSVYKVQC